VPADDAIRLGLSLVGKLSAARGAALLAERKRSPFVSMNDFKRRVALEKDELQALASGGAFAGLASHRREALWRIQEPSQGELFSSEGAPRSVPEEECPLAPMTPQERLSADFNATSLSTGPHAMQLLREFLPDAWTAEELKTAPHGIFVLAAGMVICRQRPGTAKGFVFLSLEDETGVANVVIRPALYEKIRLLIATENFLQIEGFVQQQEGVTNLRAHRVERVLSGELPSAGSHDFH
jgi:error-prone DNA polymerase